MKKQPRISFVLAALALALALGAFSQPLQAAAPLKPYKVGFNAWIGSIAFFVAQEKGFFKDEGLDVKTKTFSSPGDGLKPLVSGDLDAVLSTADSVLTVLDKAPGSLKVVYLTDTSAGAETGAGGRADWAATATVLLSSSLRV